MQLDGAKLVLLFPAESDGDLVAPAAQHESSYQHRLVGEVEGFSAARVLHRHLLSLQQAYIEHLWKGRPTCGTCCSKSFAALLFSQMKEHFLLHICFYFCLSGKWM